MEVSEHYELVTLYSCSLELLMNVQYLLFHIISLSLFLFRLVCDDNSYLLAISSILFHIICFVNTVPSIHVLKHDPRWQSLALDIEYPEGASL